MFSMSMSRYTSSSYGTMAISSSPRMPRMIGGGGSSASRADVDDAADRVDLDADDAGAAVRDENERLLRSLLQLG